MSFCTCEGFASSVLYASFSARCTALSIGRKGGYNFFQLDHIDHLHSVSHQSFHLDSVNWILCKLKLFICFIILHFLLESSFNCYWIKLNNSQLEKPFTKNCTDLIKATLKIICQVIKCLFPYNYIYHSLRKLDVQNLLD